jgi:hypothetical protein
MPAKKQNTIQKPAEENVAVPVVKNEEENQNKNVLVIV